MRAAPKKTAPRPQRLGSANVMGKNKTLETILSILSPAYGLSKLTGKEKKGKKDKSGKESPNKPKKEKKKSKWWDSIGSILGSLGKAAMKFLPMFLGNKTHSTMRAGVSSTSGMIGMAEPTAWSAGEVPNITGMGSGAIMITHSGFLGALSRKNLSTGADSVRGDLLYRVSLDPYIEGWLAKMANFERYRFRNIAITFHPALPTILSGRVMGFFESDVNNPTTGGLGDATMKEAAAHTSAIMVDCWVPHTWVYSFHDGEWLYVSGTCHEPRTSKAGVFSIIAGTDFPSADYPEILGDLLISYEVEFRNPELNATIPYGSYISVNGFDSMTRDYPFGIKPYSDAFIDGTAVPEYTIPTEISYTYTLVGPGVVGGSWFRVPAGYYAVVTYIAGTGLSASGAGIMGCAGNYKFEVGPSGDTYADEYCSSGRFFGFTYIKSSGFDSESGLRVTGLATATTISAAYITFVCLGGQVPYVNPIWSAFALVKDELKKLQDTSHPEPDATATIAFSSVSKGKRN